VHTLPLCKNHNILALHYIGTAVLSQRTQWDVCSL